MLFMALLHQLTRLLCSFLICSVPCKASFLFPLNIWNCFNAVLSLSLAKGLAFSSWLFCVCILDWSSQVCKGQFWNTRSFWKEKSLGNHPAGQLDKLRFFHGLEPERTAEDKQSESNVYISVKTQNCLGSQI